MAKKFKWVVEFSVDKIWVADGFNLTNDRALSMLESDLQLAYLGELGAKVIESPDPDSILKVQGYDVGELTKKEKKALLS